MIFRPAGHRKRVMPASRRGGGALIFCIFFFMRVRGLIKHVIYFLIIRQRF